MGRINELTTNKLVALIDNKNLKILDVRPVDAYNGWKLEKELRGGHIKGAKSLPLKWTKYMDWIEIVRSKHILPEHQIVIYGYTPEQSQTVAMFFIKAGYQDIFVYNKFIGEWAGNEDLPLEKLERYKQLVYPDWIKTIIEGGIPPEHKGGKTVICHAHYRITWYEYAA
ncbi:MAG: rhodanese-like domain-containing protein [Bacteroidota bacterium]|nr:rhodanese-like domain-containing protein [Bacteroidota bacterium]